MNYWMPSVDFTNIDRFSRLLVYVPKEFHYQDSILLYITLPSYDFLRRQMDYARQSPNPNTYEPLRSHGDAQTGISPWAKCWLQTNGLTSLPLLEVTLHNVVCWIHVRLFVCSCQFS